MRIITSLFCLICCVVTVSNATAQNLETATSNEISTSVINGTQFRSSLPQILSFPTVVVNMMPSYNYTVLSSISIAVPAVAYTYPASTNLKFRFSVTNVSNNTTAPDVIQTSRFLNIPASILAYNAEYTIKASAVIDDQVLPYAGNTITVFTPSYPLITLSQSLCGTILATLASTISANPGLNATSYTFRIRLNGDTSGTNFGYSTSSSQFVGANTFAGFPLLYGTTYNVAVQYTFPDPITGLPVNSGYGGECSFSTPKIPSTSLASPDCGSQVSSLNAPMVSLAGLYATSYQFRIRKTINGAGGPVYYYSAPTTSRFSSLSAFGIPLAYNTSYSISVRYFITNSAGTIWSGYGYECAIITPPDPSASLVPSPRESQKSASLTEQTENFTAKSYPNPFTDNFRIALNTNSSSAVNLKVYDMLGRMVEQKQISVSDLESTTIGDNYPKGIYNIVITQEYSVETVRIIKR